MLESRVRREFILSDEEVAVRHLHKVVNKAVQDYVAELKGAPE